VRPQDIKTTAHFTIEGELDDISGSGQTEAAHGLCTGIPKAKQKHLEVKGAGHYGIFSGRRWREGAYPAVKAFILSNNKPAATTAAAATAKPAVKRKSTSVALAASKKSSAKFVSSTRTQTAGKAKPATRK
jgi:poly(3-hydroxybutyrate) depolymerase